MGLLNAQQQSIVNRRPESLLEINQSVQTQMEASQTSTPSSGLRFHLGVFLWRAQRVHPQ